MTSKAIFVLVGILVLVSGTAALRIVLPYNARFNHCCYTNYDVRFIRPITETYDTI